jgi:hypothetical protein
MPVKLRTPKPRRLVFSREVLALFATLERAPKARRDSDWFRERSHELARQLGLVNEWWSMTSVTDTEREPCWPPGYIAFKDWHTCRAVRLELLAALREAEAGRAAPSSLKGREDDAHPIH